MKTHWFKQKKNHESFRLIEITDKAKGMGYEVLITSCPIDTMVIDCDKIPNMGSIFKCSKGECRRSDFILISSELSVVIVIELKESNNDKSKEIIQQLKGSACFLSYCESIIASFWGEKNVLQGYETFFVVCIPRTIKRSFNKNTIPEKFNKIFDKIIPFKKLIKNRSKGELK